MVIEQASVWEYEDFKVFLLIHAASADFKIEAEEMNVITAKYGADRYERIISLYESAGEMDIIDTILSFKSRFFPTREKADELLSAMIEVFNADKHYDQVEKIQMMGVRKLLY